MRISIGVGRNAPDGRVVPRPSRGRRTIVELAPRWTSSRPPRSDGSTLLARAAAARPGGQRRRLRRLDAAAPRRVLRPDQGGRGCFWMPAPTCRRSPNRLRNTPLHAATAGGHAEIALLLIERGADVTGPDAGRPHAAAHCRRERSDGRSSRPSSRAAPIRWRWTRTIRPRCRVPPRRTARDRRLAERRVELSRPQAGRPRSEHRQVRLQVADDDRELAGEDQDADGDEQRAGGELDGVVVAADALREREELVDGERREQERNAEARASRPPAARRLRRRCSSIRRSRGCRRGSGRCTASSRTRRRCRRASRRAARPACAAPARASRSRGTPSRNTPIVCRPKMIEDDAGDLAEQRQLREQELADRAWPTRRARRRRARSRARTRAR